MNDSLQESCARVLFAGDIRLLDEHAGSLFDEAVQAYADGFDLRCCNFEGAVPHDHAVTHKKAGPAVMQGEGAARRVLDSGFNLVTLANNHAMDYGARGLSATLDALSGAQTIGAGLSPADAYKPYIAEINGVKLGFLAVSERQYGTLDGTLAAGAAWIGEPRVLNDIRLLKLECAHVIVLCHAGLEDVHQPLLQWRELYRQFIRVGASAVVCHHPHVPQGYERYRAGVIVYSLGNTAWEPASDFPAGYSLLCGISFGSQDVRDVSLRPVVYEGGALRFDESAETAAHFDSLNRVLNDPAAYLAESRRMCRAFYEQVALPDFFTVTGALPGGAWQQFKNAWKLLLRKRALNEPLLRSMLDNESYRYAVSNALRPDVDEQRE